MELKATEGQLHRAPERQLHITDNFTLVDQKYIKPAQAVEQLTR